MNMVRVQILIHFLFLCTLAVSKNPFEGRSLYVNSRFQRQISYHTHRARPDSREHFSRLLNVSTAFWISDKRTARLRVTQSKNTFLGVLTDAVSQNPVPLVTSVVYNLPNRDCAAFASNGEICCVTKSDGRCDYTAPDCDRGLWEYRTMYIDRIAKVAKSFCGKVPMAFIIEPDSLSNLATNLDNPNCASNSTHAAYRHGIQYAVNALAEACPCAALYLDAAHGGWLGWNDNSKMFIDIVNKLNIARRLHGFAVNVANYQDLGVRCPSTEFCTGGKNSEHPCCQQDPCNLIQEWNPGHTELNYVDVLKSKVTEIMPEFQPTFVIDTARNGVPNARLDCSNWCNIRGAGIGVHPTTATDHELVDAYLWIKPPTESDGCTETLPNNSACHRFDSKCASIDSVGSAENEPRAPEAGKHFRFLLKSLVLNNHK